MNYFLRILADRQTESDAYEPTVQTAQVGSKNYFCKETTKTTVPGTCFCILQLFYPFLCFCSLEIPITGITQTVVKTLSIPRFKQPNQLIRCAFESGFAIGRMPS